MNRYELNGFFEDLIHYSESDLRYKHAPKIWSIGQMYDHLILVASEYLDEVEICLRGDGVSDGEKTPFGEKLFMEGGFPPIKIELPPEMNQPPNNTDSSVTLQERMQSLISRMKTLESQLENTAEDRKTFHGGFGWLNATEWFELVEMHTRHHRLQQRELETWIKQKDL
ncbi:MULTISPECIES: DinB family protein [unclassified Exiguobacterium]|uniref:DinB family protein n=1 Tax=unclassified Exiguobacterium TaxID=2644629 RepID=UPI001BE81583|nr:MULTISPECIES: DinB family protein [unclassified Exiguobacterium]